MWLIYQTIESWKSFLSSHLFRNHSQNCIRLSGSSHLVSGQVLEFKPSIFKLAKFDEHWISQYQSHENNFFLPHHALLRLVELYQIQPSNVFELQQHSLLSNNSSVTAYVHWMIISPPCLFKHLNDALLLCFSSAFRIIHNKNCEARNVCDNGVWFFE